MKPRRPIIRVRVHSTDTKTLNDLSLPQAASVRFRAMTSVLGMTGVGRNRQMCVQKAAGQRSVTGDAAPAPLPAARE
jgi:hypothetical protein